MGFRRLVFLAWRNLWRSWRRTLITSSTIAIGFALAVVSIGLGDGGHNQMIRNAIRMGNGHLTIQPKGYLTAPANHLYLADGDSLRPPDGLQAAGVTIAPRIFLQVLASTARNSLGAAVQGIDVEADPYRALLGEAITDGRWLEPGDRRGILIGHKMAKKLKARIGSKVVLMAGGGQGDVESQLGRVRGIFDAGNDAVDGFMIFSGLQLARNLLPPNGVDGRDAAVTRYAVFLPDAKRLDYWKSALQAATLPQNAVVLDWREMMPDLVKFIFLDDFGNYIWLAIILIVVLFGILNTILMSVLERTREFGMVRALGMRPGELLLLVIVETVLLAVVALAAGWALGGAGHYYLATVGLDLTQMMEPDAMSVGGVMLDPIMKSELSWGRVAALTGVVFSATLFSGIYPAIKASRVPPVAAIAT
ncbi:MAG: FtsX-like permease family protein [bacterium]